MNPTNFLCCPITKQVMTTPALAPCGHLFEHSAISHLSYCPKHDASINPAFLRPDPLSREIIFRVLVKNVNHKSPPDQSSDNLAQLHSAI